MPHTPKGRNERGQDNREDRSDSRRQNMSNTRSRDDGRSRRNENRYFRSTIMSSIDYDRNAE